MTQIAVFRKKTTTELENVVNEFLAKLYDAKVDVQYGTTESYYECCVVYEVENKAKDEQ